MPFPAPKINDCQGPSESASGSGLEIEEVVSRYIREADTDLDDAPNTQTLGKGKIFMRHKVRHQAH
jgi:hypothetical protein